MTTDHFANRVRQAAERRGASPFEIWMRTCTVFDPSAVETASALYASYTAHCDAHAFNVMSQRSFGEALNDRQVFLGGKDAHGLKRRKGMRLVPPAPIVSPIPSPRAPNLGAVAMRVWTFVEGLAA